MQRALLVCAKKGALVFDPLTGSGTTAVAAKELNRAFVGAELEKQSVVLDTRRARTMKQGALLSELSGHFWDST